MGEPVTGAAGARGRGRRGGAELEALVPAPAPHPATWGPALLDALAPHVGTEVAFAEAPHVLEHHAGPWAHGMTLAPVLGSSIAHPWTGPLEVRVADDRRDVDREAAAIAANHAGGLGAPEVLAVVDLPDVAAGDAGPAARAALVTTALPGVPLPELIGFNLTSSDELLRGFAAHHAAVHDLPVGAAGGAVPVLSLDDELARIDRNRFADQVAWLEAHRPPPAPAVLCHGGYQPLTVSGPGPGDWDGVGGPGHGLAVGNWCGAALAEREADVAFTLVAFWVAPHFAKSRSERTAVKMIRNTLANTYRQGYAAAADLDPERLRFWQGFHAVRGMARLAGAYDGDGSPYAVVDRGPLPPVVSRELDRLFRMQHRS